MSLDLLKDNPSAKKAIKALAPVHKDFRIFELEIVGEGKASKMKCTGAQFREAKRGPRKGQLCIEVPGTRRIAVV